MSNKKWNVVRHNGQCYVTEGDHHIIARVDDLAHADLLAAAPEMKAQRDELLAACQELQEICRSKCSPTDEVILDSGKTNHQAIIEAGFAITNALIGGEIVDISTIPDEELERDRQDSVADVIVCLAALAIGYDTHHNGLPVQERLDVNQKIIAKIEAEQARRIHEKTKTTT